MHNILDKATGSFSVIQDACLVNVYMHMAAHTVVSVYSVEPLTPPRCQVKLPNQLTNYKTIKG